MLKLFERRWKIDPNLPRDEREKALVHNLRARFYYDFRLVAPTIRKDFFELEDIAMEWYAERMRRARMIFSKESRCTPGDRIQAGTP